MRLRFLSVFAVLCIVAQPAAAQKPAPEPPGGGQAADPEALLQEAEKRYQSQDYEEALKVLGTVLQAPAATTIQKARAFLFAGVCFTALGDAEKAVLCFVELLKLQPRFRLPPGISPSIASMFKQALQRLKLPETPPPEGQGGAEGGKTESAVSLKASAPSRVTAGQPLDVRIEISDPEGQVEDVILEWRVVGGSDFSTIRVKYAAGQKVLTGRIPGAVLAGKTGRVLYRVEAMGKGGVTLANAGTINTPLEVALATPPKAKSRWGWYALGVGGAVAVAGGIVAAVLLTRSQPAPPPNTTADVSVVIR